MEELVEKTLSSSYLYRGRIINVRQDMVETAGGRVGFREVVEHPGAAAVLACDHRERILFVSQFRQPAGRVLLEIPAGKLDPGEEPLACAQRELAEETGLEARSWALLAAFYPSPGFSSEIIYLFKAGGLVPAGGAMKADQDENLKLSAVPYSEALSMIKDGRIVDGKTIIALLMASMTA